MQTDKREEEKEGGKEMGVIDTNTESETEREREREPNEIKC